jgi:hypothetical protein
MMGDRLPVTETRGGESPGDWKIAEAATEMAEAFRKTTEHMKDFTEAFQAEEVHAKPDSDTWT